MFLKIFPFVLILAGVIGFFVSYETLYELSNSSNPIGRLIFVVLSLPWWGKIISILTGVIWIIFTYSDSENTEEIPQVETNIIDKKTEKVTPVKSNVNKVSYCTNCGNPISETSKFCTNCGNKKLI